jgi:hypothetical protein
VHFAEVGGQVRGNQLLRTFGALDPAALSFAVSVTLSSHSTFVGIHRDVAVMRTGQADHEFCISNVNFEVHMFKKVNENIQSLLQPFSIHSRELIIINIEQQEDLVDGAFSMHRVLNCLDFPRTIDSISTDVEEGARGETALCYATAWQDDAAIISSLL